jgi:hypothetical protein
VDSSYTFHNFPQNTKQTIPDRNTTQHNKNNSIMSTHGLPDEAIKEAHDMIHHAEQEEHEHEAAAKRGLPDSAAEAEYDLIHHAEEELEQTQVRWSITDRLHPWDGADQAENSTNRVPAAESNKPSRS